MLTFWTILGGVVGIWLTLYFQLDGWARPVVALLGYLYGSMMGTIFYIECCSPHQPRDPYYLYEMRYRRR